jgi:hypothetical protein
MRPYHGARVGVAAGDLPFLPVDTTRLHLTDETTRTLWRSVAPSATAPGIYRALGHDFRLSKDIDWHLDPASGCGGRMMPTVSISTIGMIRSAAM